MYDSYRDIIYKILTNPTIDQVRAQIKTLILNSPLNCYQDYINCLEKICSTAQTHRSVIQHFKDISDLEVQAKLIKLLDYEFKRFTGEIVISRPFPLVVTAEQPQMRTIWFFKKAEANYDLIKELTHEYHLPWKELVNFNREQLQRIKNTFLRLHDYLRKAKMEEVVIRLPRMPFDINVCLKTCINRAQGKLAIVADVPAQFDWQLLSTFHGSLHSFVITAILAGSKNFLAVFFAKLPQDHEIFGENYYRAYYRLAARCGQSEIFDFLTQCHTRVLTKNMVLDAAASGNESFFMKLKQHCLLDHFDEQAFDNEIMMYLVLSGDTQLLQKQSDVVAVLQALSIDDLYLTIGYAVTSGPAMLQLILNTIITNNINHEGSNGLRTLSTLISDLINGGITINALEIVVTAFYPDGWVPDVSHIRTAVRVGNVTLFEWLRKQTTAVEIDDHMIDAARRSNTPAMLEHVSKLMSTSQTARIKMRVTS